MPSQAELVISLHVKDAEGRLIISEPSKTYRWTVASTSGKREPVALGASASTTLSVPASAKYLVLLVQSAVSLTLEGAALDTGIAITPATNPIQAPVMIPLGASPAVVVTNGTTAQTAVAIWL